MKKFKGFSHGPNLKLTTTEVKMAMQQLTLPGQIVKKHNELVRSKINIANKTASRILACLVAAIRHGDTQFKDSYTVPVKDYLPLDEGGGKGGKQYKLVKAACRDLIGATMEQEWPDPDNPDGDPIFLVVPFLTSIKYRKGKVEAKFNPEMSELLLQLRQFFTEYNLIEYLLLPSTYSQRLFEILKSWSNLPEKSLSVAELHKLLDTPVSFRSDFRQFRVYVLEKAHKDILAHTKLHFEWEPVKAGRSVEKIRFLFAPGRKAIAEAEQQKAKETKQRRLETQRYRRASDCAKAKKGECVNQDNRPIVCKLCLRMDFCGDVRRRGGKPFDPTKGV
jgi:plasmid replication initiation protein